MVESSALLKRRSPKGYRGFESLPHRHRISDLRFPILDCEILLLLVIVLVIDHKQSRTLPRANWPESVIVHVIAHPAPRSNPFCLVEGPVDAEINSALAVLFLSL